MPNWVIAYRLRLPSGCPSSRTCPAVGRYTPVITLKQVVLPAPFGPISPRISPRLISKETESSATRPPKRSVTSRMASRVSPTPTSISRSGATTSATSASCLARSSADMCRNSATIPPTAGTSASSSTSPPGLAPVSVTSLTTQPP